MEKRHLCYHLTSSLSYSMIKKGFKDLSWHKFYWQAWHLDLGNKKGNTMHTPFWKYSPYQQVLSLSCRQNSLKKK